MKFTKKIMAVAIGLALTVLLFTTAFEMFVFVAATLVVLAKIGLLLVGRA